MDLTCVTYPTVDSIHKIVPEEEEWESFKIGFIKVLDSTEYGS